MMYFIILPVYMLLLAVLLIAALVARNIEAFRPASGYIVGATVGSLPGLVIVNLIVMAGGILPLLIAPKIPLPEWLRQTLGVGVGLVLLIGPFVASAIGLALGIVGGLLFVYRRRKKRGV